MVHVQLQTHTQLKVHRKCGSGIEKGGEVTNLQFGNPLAVPVAHVVPLDEKLSLPLHTCLHFRFVRRHVVEFVDSRVVFLPTPKQDLLDASVEWRTLQTRNVTYNVTKSSLGTKE